MKREDFDTDIFLPYVGIALPVGERMLSQLKEERDYLNTVIVTELRRTTTRINYRNILETAAGRIVISGHPVEPKEIPHQAWMTYKGRRVSIYEDFFFSWYGGTEEGQRVKAILDREHPGSWGHFARLSAHVPEPDNVYKDPDAKCLRGDGEEWKPGELYDWGRWRHIADEWILTGQVSRQSRGEE